MSRIFVVDAQRRPLMPCTPARARILLHKGKATILRRFPLTLILREARPEAVVLRPRLKIDPGSKTTGLAIVNDANGEVVWAAELTHRSQPIRDALLARRAVRRSRRSRKTRYRPARFQNRRRPAGWLAPSLLSRIQHILTWVRRLRSVCPLGAISQELARFDTQALQQPESSGLEYQRGELMGYELRTYLLEKWQRRCVYCGAHGIPLELDHLMPKSRGGSDRASNLVVACHSCNQHKGSRTAAEFGHAEVEAQAKQPLRDAAAINATRWRLYQELCATGLPVEVGTGGRTSWNRSRLGLPKAHWLDAAAVGVSTPPRLRVQQVRPLQIAAKGWQRRQMCLMDAHGFPRTRAKEQSRVKGFRTGDLVRAVVPTGKKAGVHVGRVAVRASGSFNLTTARGTVQGINARHCTILYRRDGYMYAKGEAALLPIP